MEALGAFSDGEWDSLTAMLELDQSLIPNSTELIQFPNNGGSDLVQNSSSWFYSLDAFDQNLQSFVKQDMSFSSNSCSSTDNSSDFVMPNPIAERNFGSSFFSDVLMEEVVDKDLSGAGEDCWSTEKLIESVLLQGTHLPPPLHVAGKEPIALKRKVNNNGEFSDNQRKKSRVSGDGEKKKNKSQQKRRGEIVEEEGNEGQSSISYSSEEDHGGSATTSDGGLNGKARASRGSATDPQSLYARKRREKINERLRILQKLVPNGTKVDISTMLEEAVHYVKFLQVQIKLLSSDEMWMFAPLAYNGMDLGLNQNLSPFLSH